MKTLTLSLMLLWSGFAAIAQQRPGLVKDEKGQPVHGATVIVFGTLQGASTDSAGRFVIHLAGLKDTVLLKISAIGYEDAKATFSPKQSADTLLITLKQKKNVLADVVISAGSFEASDEKKATTFKPFDLATVPASPPDEFKAVNELPGTTKVGETEGLFVRGGDATETKAIIDGLIVQDPFFGSVPGVAQNSRFSTLLFKGTSFSTGGYSAQYGDALSSVLVLNTQDVAQASSQSITLSTAGISGNITQRWDDNTSLALNARYTNLQPSFAINKQNYSYFIIPQGEGGNIIFRHKAKKGGLFKFYGSYDRNQVGLSVPYLSVNPLDNRYSLNGRTLYTNATYKVSLGKWALNSGVSYSHNIDQITFDSSQVQKADERLQARIVASRYIGTRSKLSFGAEGEDAHFSNSDSLARYALTERLLAAFAESEFYLGNRIAVRAGVRGESANYGHGNIAPRASVAYVVNPYSQFSAAYGDFYQLPAETYLYTNPQLSFEEATHYIVDYQYKKNNRTFRIEGYYKHYNNLVKEPDTTSFTAFSIDRIPPVGTQNSGYGYADGFDLFWYDKRSIPNLDYWVSYSYLDTRRLFQNYLTEATPTFAAKHNVSVVVKYNIPTTSVNLGLSYNYTSGRPYYDPQHAFLSDRTPPVNNIVFSGNYSWFVKNNLIALFFYCDNLAGIHNIYNYYYSADGNHHYTLTPPAYRSIYAGINITLAKRRTIMGINF